MLLKTSHIYKIIIRNLVRVRFAPSPTGRMHIGGLRIAFYNYLFAKKHNGEFLLRIEDTDRERFKSDSIDNIISSLKWTKIIPDHGPGFSQDSNDASQYFQSNRLDKYKIYAQRLIDKNLAYKCYCDETRLDLLRRTAIQNQEKQAYDGKCRHLTPKQIEEFSDRPHVIRFKLENKVTKFNDLVFGACEYNLFEQEGDFVLVKSDGYPTYHFANIVDDHLMRITHVLRGQEWLTSTPKHLLLYEALDITDPPNYAHFPLILNKDGSKLSKRNNDIDVMSFKERGYLPEALLGYLTTFGGGFRMDGGKLEIKYIDELVELFDLNLIVKRSIKYNEDTLLNVNKEVLERKIRSNEEVKGLVNDLRALVKEEFKSSQIDSFYLSDNYLNLVLNLTVNRLSKLNDLLGEEYAYLWYKTEKSALKSIIDSKFKGLELSNKKINEMIEGLILFLQKYEVLNNDEAALVQLKIDMDNELKAMKSRFETNKFNLWLFFRIILCGNLVGPPVVEIICLLGKENILYRLNIIKKMFQN
jgi:glutamyl-tRNA synthetase